MVSKIEPPTEPSHGVSAAPERPRPPESLALEQLLSRAAGGDAEALGAFYDATSARTYGLALRILGDRSAAEDVLVEVYEQVWRIAGDFDPARGGPLTWLLRLARTRALDWLRAKNRRAKRSAPLAAAAHCAADGGAPAAGLLVAEQSAILAAAVLTLPPAQREAVETAYFGSLSYAEAAAALTVPVGTFKTRMRAALAALKAALTPDGPTSETPR